GSLVKKPGKQLLAPSGAGSLSVQGTVALQRFMQRPVFAGRTKPACVESKPPTQIGQVARLVPPQAATEVSQREEGPTLAGVGSPQPSPWPRARSVHTPMNGFEVEVEVNKRGLQYGVGAAHSLSLLHSVRQMPSSTWMSPKTPMRQPTPAGQPTI